MRAVVYRGVNDLRLKTVPVPGSGDKLSVLPECGHNGRRLRLFGT